jgi:30S ribosomal protein S31
LTNPAKHPNFAPHFKETFMGKGDKKSKKGKMFMGSYGNSRPSRVQKAAVGASAAPATSKAATATAAAAKPKK